MEITIKKLQRYLLIFFVFLSFNLCFASELKTKHFKTYKDFFTYLVEQNPDFSVRDENIVKLAAESTIERIETKFNENVREIILVVKLDYFDGLFSRIRGAQSNGDFYILKVLNDGFEIVGIMRGNRYNFGTFNGRPRFYSDSHMSYCEGIEDIYDWDGEFFKLTSSILYRYKEDGTRVKLKEYDKTK